MSSNFSHRYLFLVAGFLVAGAVGAAPFIVSDPTAQVVTHCGYILDGAAKVDSVVATSPLGKSCKIDIGAVAVGSHTLTASFVNIDAVYGRSESPMTPNFTFVVPSKSLTTPIDLRIAP